MENSLAEYQIAFIATDGFEPSELIEPLQALREAGAQCTVIAPKSGSIKGWKKEWKETVEVNATFSDVDPERFDALVIPGGTLNCDSLRTNEDAIAFVRSMVKQKKPVSAICHGPQMLIEAEAVAGRQMTSYQAIKTDLMNAGANWVDQEVVCDQGITTSRTPDDLQAFIAKTMEEIKEGKHSQRAQ